MAWAALQRVAQDPYQDPSVTAASAWAAAVCAAMGDLLKAGNDHAAASVMDAEELVGACACHPLPPPPLPPRPAGPAAAAAVAGGPTVARGWQAHGGSAGSGSTERAC